ncbi:MAG: helix-turn-helix transcriptional regulator [Steroidobacter sp.]
MNIEEKIVPAQAAPRVALQRIDLKPACTMRDADTLNKRRIRMLRLAQVREMTGLGKTKIYELQAEGDFPMRVKITEHSVAWIEDEVQAWLARRVEGSTPLCTLWAGIHVDR